jgi:hypothetical protein
MSILLSRGDLKVETESEIITAQGQAVQNKYISAKIFQTEIAICKSLMKQ